MSFYLNTDIQDSIKYKSSETILLTKAHGHKVIIEESDKVYNIIAARSESTVLGSVPYIAYKIAERNPSLQKIQGFEK